jgi:tRNA dimethylallyltransferase
MTTKLKFASTPIFLVGATGTGKSAAAMEVARDWARAGVHTAILCMDAMQVYRGADIGTSKPTAAERAEVPHGGLDLVDFAPAVSSSGFDVAQYLRHAEAFLREQREAGRRVIIVGGTGLYFRALTRGLCEAPQGSDELRAELSSLSVEQLRERLRKIDPAMLERVDAANPRRLVRAIEVMEATGRSLREWQEETPEALVPNFTAVWIQREKAELEERIAQRVEAMFAQGWVEEVRGLVERYGLEAVRGFAGIGYREIAEELREPDQISKLTKFPNFEGGNRTYGTYRTDRTEEEDRKTGNEIAQTSAFPSATWERGTPAEGSKLGNGERQEGTGGGPAPATLRKVKSDIVVATRQYAKRQLTWFAREPSLQKVMLTGDKPLTEALCAAVPDLF